MESGPHPSPPSNALAAHTSPACIWMSQLTMYLSVTFADDIACVYDKSAMA